MTKCACCGGGYPAISQTHIGCSTARNKGTCDNRVNIRGDELEARVLNALKTRLVDPSLALRSPANQATRRPPDSRRHPR
ncbi:recombinase zinc beta ribbon domain-containing protein [Bradyrhizobium embrapense]